MLIYLTQYKHEVNEYDSKFTPIISDKGPEVEYMYRSTLSLTSVLEVVRGQRHAPGALHQGKKTGTHKIGGWADLRAGLYG